MNKKDLVIGLSAVAIVILGIFSLSSDATGPKTKGLPVTGTLNSQTQSALVASANAGSCDAVDGFWKYDNSLNTWEQQANFGGGARESAVGFTIGYKAYVGTGKDEFGIKKDFWEWNGDTGIWTQKADFGGGERQQAIGFTIGEKGYVGTGYNTNDFSVGTSDFWEYNPATNSWIQKMDFGGGVRARAIGFTIGDKGYVGTGDQNGALMKDFWEWNRDTNIWTQKTDFGGIARIEAIGFPIGYNGYVGTGSDYELSSTGNPPSLYKDFWTYDSINNTWAQKADYAGGEVARAVGFSALGDEFGYVGTGLSSTGLRKDFWQYNPNGNTWIQKQDFSGGKIESAVGLAIRNYGFVATGTSCNLCTPNTWTKKANYGGNGVSYATGFSIGTKGYIGTGINSSGDTKSFWEYNQATDVWTQKADFGGMARNRAVGFSMGTKGYIGTGTAGTSESFGFNDFWEWDQGSNIWTQKANLTGFSRFGAVGFSVGDKGYITTGKVGGTIYLDDLWEYNFVNDTWIAKANFGGGKRVSAVGFSLDGMGYVGTGLPSDTFGGPLRDFWAYSPASDSWKQIANFGGVARHEAVGFSMGSKGYSGTGQGDAGLLLDFWSYDPSANTWIRKANHGGGQKANGVGFSMGGKGYIGTGVFDAKSFWEYCPD